MTITGNLLQAVREYIRFEAENAEVTLTDVEVVFMAGELKEAMTDRLADCFNERG